MKIKAAVLRVAGLKGPYRDTKPLSIETVDLDRPEREEVLIKIAAAGLCHSDLVAIDGERPKPMPIVLGHETVGVVSEVGPGVTAFEEGDYVIPSFVASCGKCEMCRIGRPGLCVAASDANAKGTLMSGGQRLHKNGARLYHHSGVSAFAEFAVVSEHSLVKIDHNIPAQHAALFGCAVMTGAGAVINTSGIKAGESVAVIGAGGVGLSAVMAAAAAGSSQVLAIDINDEKLHAAKNFGATHVFNATDPDMLSKVKAVTGGGVHIAIESAGVPQALELAFEVTRIGGCTVAAGLPNPEKKINISHFLLGAQERTLKGSYMGSCIPSRDIPKLLNMYRQGNLAVDKLASDIIGFDDLNEAFDLMGKGGALRNVLVP
ncbi:zinc-binding dehydrogenase [Marinobacterium rhizophilum]|uniref:Alcohol dehydrogenase catalytic domain-containing protein n=1 Tax=Marinobacterium rhizophilum TaxID=420402 RepID=A0ABY5HI44_9GAMM|nr:zinc-binding dehydrogenase [Marinobacterium rhizophilum]UTW11965.1 alcohol dehydrogenase catalytic domain-containing protein [Marinobacterium rhizophilum]